MYLVEYYQSVFWDLQHRFARELDGALLRDPAAVRRKFWRRFRNRSLSSIEAWEVLHEYIKVIERCMADIASKHSIFFWLHLYRRIGVALHDGHKEQSSNPYTVMHVRLIVESAIMRHGSLNPPDDIKLSHQARPEEIMGGLWLRRWEDLLDQEEANRLFDELAASRQWVMTRFSHDDFMLIYRLEGFAYEYWLSTAMMRSAGKGSELEVSGQGEPNSKRSSDLADLLLMYDMRSAAHSFQASAVAVAFDSLLEQSAHLAPIAQYNVFRYPYRELASPAIAARLPPEDVVTNFFFSIFDMDSYVRNHEFIDTSFVKKHGFSIAVLCSVISAIARLELARQDTAVEIRLWNLLQRSYSIATTTSYFKNLKEVTSHIMTNWIGKLPDSFDQQFESIRDYLTIDVIKQTRISLWSLGPRFAFIPLQDTTLVDLLGFEVLLRNAFFGLAFDAGPKGRLFEEYFRTKVAKAGFDLLEIRNLDDGASVREIDAAIRIGNVLVLCECRAMEKPLDFDLGRPATIQKRIAMLDAKVTQAISIRRFVRDNLRGRNYDFTWASRIIPIVVSPFVEWTWSFDERLWLAPNRPLIVSDQEALHYLHDLASEEQVTSRNA